jgi:UPF0755 protein
LKKLFYFVAIVMALVFAAAYYAQMERIRFMNAPMSLGEQNPVYSLEKGSSASQVATELSAKNWISGARWLRLHLKFFPEDGAIKAGEYQLHQGMTPLELLQLFKSGEVIRYHATLVEGLKFKESLQSLEQHPDVVKKLDLSADIWPQLNIVPEHSHVEGQFFPDTYHFVRGDSDIDILRRAYLRMQVVLAEEWEKRAEDLPYKNAYEALIMASIVEKETGQPHERSEIAGVFVRRLKKGMRLQTDPTVIYGLGDDYQGNIRKRHLLDASNIYNTYQIKALPPTPIALAGRAAINAALQPKPGTSLYFVAKGDGSHQFSATFAEHEKAVRVYQIERRRADYRSAPSAEKAATEDTGGSK